ncbi:MAG: signal peptidase II [Spirochaetes bacterium GWF1_31_7]|nr:MAG: signal peptidase II [Spirochaetes bacterium GWE1_32_154]OHD45685.1 MAG: signal peptidase II [Spirochaetes bacterium GWE2_31_10]OHD47679.1 MAG: signal peptidase II [Spirochaetes bacterium GWF1_31_7]
MNFKRIINEKKIIFKLSILALFILLFTGSDLLVKKIVENKLRVIPETFEQNMFENYIIKFDTNQIISNSYQKQDNGTYNLIEKNPKNLHKLWKEIRKFRFDKDIVVIKDVWHFVYETNEDIGFSILSFLDNFLTPDTKRIFLICLQGFGVLIIFLYYLYSKEWYQFFPLAMIISGALGNVIDRIMRGYVVDFVMWIFKFIPHRLFNPWPIFNLADVYTVIGAIALFIMIMIFDSSEKNK